MGIEIERKFLLKNDDWRENVEYTLYKQGYIAIGPPASVRIRIADSRAILNIKQSTLEISRDEYEYEIPLSDGERMLEYLCAGKIVVKNRFTVHFEGFRWEIDEFQGGNLGLIIAELELDSVEQCFSHPPWLGVEVSQDKRYFNTYLSKHPYTTWSKK